MTDRPKGIRLVLPASAARRAVAPPCGDRGRGQDAGRYAGRLARPRDQPPADLVLAARRRRDGPPPAGRPADDLRVQGPGAVCRHRPARPDHRARGLVLSRPAARVRGHRRLLLLLSVEDGRLLRRRRARARPGRRLSTAAGSPRSWKGRSRAAPARWAGRPPPSRGRHGRRLEAEPGTAPRPRPACSTGCRVGRPCARKEREVPGGRCAVLPPLRRRGPPGGRGSVHPRCTHPM